jgi:hypothetical protein
LSLANRRPAPLTPTRLKHHEVVKVTWVDAWLDTDSETSLSNISDKLKECVDIGILIKKTRKTIILAGNYEEEDQVVRFVTRIPAVLVIKIEKATGFETIFEKNPKSAPKSTEGP